MCIRKGKEIKNSSSTYGSTLLQPSTRTQSYGTPNESWCSITMRLLESRFQRASLWNADDWATQGGRVKTDWTKAPFTASYRKFNVNANKVGSNSKLTSSENDNQAWSTQGLDAAGRNRIRWVQNKHMIYNYCDDKKRFPNGLPVECT
ncbi:hypothetical protein L1987_85419 [Smallanthus sonchifolius]|uniref:Uncharacterized protein n=1 Tax=Smallanthus sonchifolius TaxID=185202 RepID=A0ACB8XX37_9ASTR|nr:hypothetical protein L1987_85419 [Smallanthus sonchifolius]